MRDGWRSARFRDVLDIVSGRNQRAVESESGPYPIYGSGGVIGRASDYLCEAGTTIIGRKGSINSPIFVDRPFWNVDTAFGLAPKDGLDPKFLFRFCELYDFARHNKGTTLPSLVKTDLLAIAMPVPPPAEQRRIVGILDEAFDGIATARQNAERNLRNARALFESYLDSVFSRPGEGWTERHLAQAVEATCTLSYGIVQPGEEYPNGLPVVRPMDLTTKTISASGLKRIDPKRADSYQRTRLHGGELLLCVRGSTGVVSVASTELASANVTRGIVPVRFDSAAITQDFGYYLLRSDAVQRQVRQKTYGAALMQINIRDVRGIGVWYPSLKEQAAFVARLDKVSAITESLEANSQRKLAVLDELRQSLLQQAFSGRLLSTP